MSGYLRQMSKNDTISKLKKVLVRAIEETMPFIFLLRNIHNIDRRLDGDLASDSEFVDYGTLSEEELLGRIKEEHERKCYMDEKTYKMTLAITIGLTVLGSVMAVLVRDIESHFLSMVIGILAMLSILYVLSGGSIALHSLSTRTTHGYGTRFLIKSKQKDAGKEVLVSALASQELENIKGHLRNEAAYQCVRNGMMLLFGSVTVYVIAVVMQLLVGG